MKSKQESQSNAKEQREGAHTGVETLKVFSKQTKKREALSVQVLSAESFFGVKLLPPPKKQPHLAPK
jgi:hypothetical protein